jgi:nickel-dependent lactate racemase
MATLQHELSEILPSLDCGPVAAGCETGIEALLEEALARPIDHPALTESIFPGDRVAILVQNGLPAARETLSSLIRVLEKARIETENILVVVPPDMIRTFDLTETVPADPKSGTPSIWQMNSQHESTTLQFEVHDSEDERAASYLAANTQGNPVYVNRSLCDSDVILPLSFVTSSEKGSDCLYPEFSTSETRERYRKKEDSLQQRNTEVELANDSLGLFFTIELVCSPGESVEDIVCGARTQARRIATDRLKPYWQLEAPAGSDAVVVTIESAGETATWNEVVKAVKTAATAVVDGPIVVWTLLSEKPKAKIKVACQAQFEGSVPDALPENLQHFASILCERPVYLKSRLSQNVVEGLGLGHVESTESAQRILSTHSNPLLIRDGHLRG